MDAIHTTTDFGIAGPWLAEYTLTAVGAGVVLFDANGRIVQWDRHASELLGVSEQDLAGRALHDDAIGAFWHDRSRLTPADDPVADVLTSGVTTSGLTIGVAAAKQPATRWLTLNLLPVFGVDHAPRAVFASLVDGTATVEARSDTTAWHMALRSVTRSAIAAVILLDRHGEILEWNEQVISLSGLNEIDLISAKFSDVCDVDVDWLWRELDDADAGGVEGVTFVAHRLDREIAVHGRFSVLDHPEYGQVAMAQLLPPREGTAEAQPDTGVNVFERSVVPMLVLTDSGTIVDANPAAVALLERTRTTLIGDPAICHLGGLASDDLHRAIADAKVLPVPIDAGRCVDRRATGRDLSVMVSTTMSDSPSALLLVQLIGGLTPQVRDEHPSAPPRRT